MNIKMNNIVQSEQVSNKNFINIKISYEKLVLVTFASCVSLISCLCFLYYKLSIAHNSIEKLQENHEALNLVIKESHQKNEKLLESLANLTLQNQQIQRIFADLQSENIALLETISKINHNKINTSMYIDQSTFLTIVLGLTVIGVVTYGGFTFVNCINAKYANSSIGLLLAGIDKHLIWLGEKTGIIQTKITQTLIDQFSNTYTVEIKGDKVINILINDQGNLTEIGVYISNLLSNINSQQILAVDLLTSQVSIPVMAVNTATTPAAQMIENAARLSSIF